jgi:RNA recognition motif-containing protein
MMSADGAEDLATMDILTLEDTDINIFVGNLAFTTTEQDLRQLFEPYGTVDTIRIMTDRDTGRSRGFGCVEMPDRHADQDAMAGLHGTPRAGRTLTVNAARPRAPRPLRW